MGVLWIKKSSVGSTLPQAEAERPPRARGRLVGRGAARVCVVKPSLPPFLGPIFLLISGAGRCASVWVAWCACLLVLGRCCGCVVLCPCFSLEEEPGLLLEVRANSAVGLPAALFLLLPFASPLGCVPVRLSGCALRPSD